MTPEQIDACRNRNDQLKHDIATQQPIAINTVSQATNDIDGLLIDLALAIERAQFEERSRQQWEQDLAREKRLTADLKTQNKALMGAVGPLRDKLSKARAILKDIDEDGLTPKEKEALKDIMRD